MSSSKILVIYPGHNATVGLFEEGKAPFILQEEKLANIKNYIGTPEKSIRHISDKLGQDFHKIESFLTPMENMLFLFVPDKTDFIEKASCGWLRSIWNYLEYKGGYRCSLIKNSMLGIRNFILNRIVSPKCKKEFEGFLNRSFSIPGSKIKYMDHHTCHCFSPVSFYNLNEKKDKYLLISMDGAGDMSFAKIFIYDSTKGKDEYSLVSSSGFEASLGLLYSEVTKFLGMKPNEHEYKVMGLAAFVSDPKYYSLAYERLKDLVWLDKESLTFKSKINLNIAHFYLKEKLSGIRFDNVSAAIQKLVENYVCEWIEAAVEKTGIRKIACSGGVFLNVKMNKIISESNNIDEVYFMPSAGDESTVFGAYYLQAMKNNVTSHSPKSMYLGLKYSNQEVEKFLKEKGYFQKHKIDFVEGIEEKLANLLASGEIVARFKGKGEFGARALGHRSILGNASDIRTFYKVNDMIKMRDFWMPFAPTVLEEWAPKYIKNWDSLKNRILDSSRFMIIAFDSTPLAIDHLLAAIHPKDKTLRPQILNEEMDPDYYCLLKHFESLTGMGGLLNTSLNLHGYPLVGTLEQAVFTFDNSGLEYIAIENFLISKKS